MNLYNLWAGTVQLVECPIEKPSAILTRVRVRGAACVFSPKSTFSAASVTMSVKPSCAITCVDICAHVKIPNTGSHTTVGWTHQNTAHTHRSGHAALQLLRLLCLKPVLNWANVCSPNILRTVRRTVVRFLIELLDRRTWFGQFDELYFVLNWLVMR